MDTIQRFEDLIAWQKARSLTAKIYSITSIGNFSRDFGLREQIRRAAVSTMSNIAEGFERSAPNEFHQFLVVAKASCAEVRSQLYIAMDVGYLSKSDFDILHQEFKELARVIGGLRSAVDKKRTKKINTTKT
ncbi:MAG: four helix bundle protein [Chromatiales bacterium]|nr:four helix bundle protein [Gammaproteobacteria bacterium]MBW6477209.1 four helix bundle protein [Chromatiales bacterium]